MKTCNLKRRLGFKQNQIEDAFEGENMQTEYHFLGYRTDLYFPDYRLAIEINEFCHWDRNIEYEKERERILKKV